MAAERPDCFCCQNRPD